MKGKRQMQSAKSGSALVIVMLAAIMFSIMGVALLRLGLSSRIFAVRTAAQIKARCAADAGLTKALYEMNEKFEITPWSENPLPQATDEILLESGDTFSYTVTVDASGTYNIESIGNSGQVEKNVFSSFEVQGLFEFAIFAKNELSLYNGVIVDGYNYSEGDSPLKIGTKSTESDNIELKNNSVINGTVVVGLDGDPGVVIKDLGATITDGSYAATQIIPLPSVIVPQWLDDLPSGGDIENSITITNSGKYENIDLRNSDIIIIDGDVTLYITEDITLSNSAQIQIVDTATNPNASLTLYLGGDYEGKNSSSINNLTTDPKKLKIYGLESCEDMRFKNDTAFYGAIYAPDAYVTFDNSASAFGSVIAEEFEQKNSAAFNYDASLRDVNVNDELVRFVIKQWREE